MLTINPFNNIKSVYNSAYCSVPVSFRAAEKPAETVLQPAEAVKFDIKSLTEKYIKPENIKGSGANSVVYNMPEYPNYVLKVLNKPDPNHVNMRDLPINMNFGQPIWSDGNIQILKKLEGWEHSAEGWTKIIYNPETKRPQPVTKEQAAVFSKKIGIIAEFPESSFKDIAQKIQILEEKGYKVDSINPNNLLVDEKNKALNVVDFFRIMPWDKPKNVFSNSYYDILAMIADFTLFPEYYDKLDGEDKNILLNNIEKIKTKAKKGAMEAGLSTSVAKFAKYIYYIVQFPECQVQNICNYVRKYDRRFVDFYSMMVNPKKWAGRRL